VIRRGISLYKASAASAGVMDSFFIPFLLQEGQAYWSLARIDNSELR
jgi:hypothetical protein